MKWPFDNSYARLPEYFFARVNPVPVCAPKMAVFNRALALSLGLDADALAGAADLFAGNEIPEGASPLAQAYAGHQFGHLNMLGDGRANLLGEILTPTGERLDIHLKGSGQTPFSRRGDGRAALGPMLREYLISEAMFALGIPTTRSLAVVTTGEITYREKELTGAILTRVAASHIRVGTFVYAARIEEPEALRILADYTIKRHYPELLKSTDPYLDLFSAVVERQASLIAKWMLVGFIHGVMNTDNMTLSGETIDFGPCAFMDHYSPATVFSSIDRNGRYAFGNQPRIGEWNLARLAEAMVPLFDADAEKGAVKAGKILAAYSEKFQSFWLSGMRKKLGLDDAQADDLQLIGDLLKWMEKNQADHTNTFRGLAKNDSEGLAVWRKRWLARKPDFALMDAVNPAVIPRNHKVEEALAKAEQGDYSVFHRLLAALQAPYTEHLEFREPAPLGGAYQTFCGT